MNKIYRILLRVFFFFFFFPISAQVKTITVIDSISHEPIPYASVLFIQKDFGGKYTNEEGKVLIPDSLSEIKINHISYNAKEVNLKNLKSNKILLSPNIKEISEITVTKKNKYKKTEIGFHNLKSKSSFRGANGFMMALFIPYNISWEIQPYISTIIGLLKKSPKNEVTALRIDLQKPDKITKAPDGISLLNENIILKNKKIKTKNNITLQEPILFPKEGVFIVIEWIDVSNNFQNLSPFIPLNTESDLRRTWMKRIYAGDSWKVLPIANDGVFQGKNINICFGLTILE